MWVCYAICNYLHRRRAINCLQKRSMKCLAERRENEEKLEQQRQIKREKKLMNWKPGKKKPKLNKETRQRKENY